MRRLLPILLLLASPVASPARAQGDPWIACATAIAQVEALRGLCAPGRRAAVTVAPNGRPRVTCRA
jgi:hypothetical protein